MNFHDDTTMILLTVVVAALVLLFLAIGVATVYSLIAKPPGKDDKD